MNILCYGESVMIRQILKSMKYCIVASIAAMLGITTCADTLINVHGEQRSDSKIVDIYYDINDPYGETYTVEVAIEGIDGVVPATTFSGDIGDNVIAGDNRHIMWNAGADWSNKKGELRVIITAVANNSPSGVQLWKDGPYWADRNVGASKPEGYGLYFWWGDTIGHAPSGESFSFSFDASNCPTYDKDEDTLKSDGWITSDGVLAPAHDAAHIKWGGNWRMPTLSEMQSLINNCSWTWTSRNGVNGYTIRGKNSYSSNSIFMPCAGVGFDNTFGGADSSACYWQSVPNTDWNCAAYLFFHSSRYYTMKNYRSRGCSVRPVQDSLMKSTVENYFYVDTSFAIFLAPESADWRTGTISFKCEDADTSGTTHTYRLAWYNQADDAWVLADGDTATNVQVGSDGYAHLSDTKFATRNNGVGTVKYRVMDETGRTAECFARERHALYIALDVYENDWQKDLSQPKIYSPSYLMNVFRRACERYGRVGGYSQPLANEDATTNAIQSQLNYMATYVTEPGDAVLVYYCGHGANEWLTCYGQNERLTKTDLFNALDVFPQGVGIVVVIDACHSTSMIEKGITEDNRIAWITAALKDEYSSSDYFSAAFCEDGWFNGLADNSTTIGDMDGYVSFWELAKYAQLEMAKDYSRHKQICTFWNDDMLKNMVAGRSLTSSKTDRIFRWLTKHTSAFSSTGSNMEVAVATTAANGIHTIADCYELGIDPDNPDDDFRITHFEMVNGEPVFELNHTTDGSGESFLPRIKKLGKADLKDNWSEVPPGGESAHRFFTVEVMKGE